MSNHWRHSILDDKCTMGDAIKLLEKVHYGIAFVINCDNELVGTVTDGDIRRSLLNGLEFNSNILDVLNKNSHTVNVNYKTDEILEIFNNPKIDFLPVLDDKKIVDVLRKKGYKSFRYDNLVVIMAGGFGTRLRPLTNNTPKPMLKIGNKPILEIIISQLKKQGFWNFYISTHFLSEKIQEYFKDGKKMGVSIKYIHEKKPLGTGGALSLLPDDEKRKPLILMNGDLLTKVDFTKILHFHENNNCSATMCVRKYDLEVPFGVVECESDGFVRKIDEKPTQKFFVNAGAYILSNDIVSSVKKDQLLDMPTLLNHEIGNNRKVASFPMHEYWMDIGRMEQFNQAQEDVKFFN